MPKVKKSPSFNFRRVPDTPALKSPKRGSFIKMPSKLELIDGFNGDQVS